MKKQYVVFGIDRFGASVARTLEENGCQVIAVDNDPEKVKMIADDVSYAMTADVEDSEAIMGLGLNNVDGAIITMVDHMEASIVAAMTCQELGMKYILARAKNDMHGKILEKIGVTVVVYPEQEMGVRVGRYIAAQDFMDWIALSPDYSLVEAIIPDEWIGKSLIELNLRKKYGFNVVGIKRGSEIIMEVNPSEPLKADTYLYVIGKNKDLERFQS